MKQFFSEVLLIISTNDINNFEYWIEWYINYLGFEHAVIIDNDSTVDIKSVCELYDDKVSYIKRSGNISQCDIYTEFVNNSNAYWVLPVDDDEYLYINDKYEHNINKLLLSLIDRYPDTFKFTIEWLMMFSENIMRSRDMSKPYIETFNYYLKGDESFEESIKNCKTIVNTLIKHKYFRDDNVQRSLITLEDLNIYHADARNYLTSYKTMYNHNKPVLHEFLGNCHQPLSILYGKHMHAINVNNGCIDISYISHGPAVDENSDAMILHFKYRTIDEWNYKINERKRFSDLYEGYSCFQNISLIQKAYKYNFKFNKFNKAINMHKKIVNIPKIFEFNDNINYDLNDITLVTCDAGKSYMTYYMIASLKKLNIKMPIVIMCNKNNIYLDIVKDLLKDYDNIIFVNNFDYNLLKHDIKYKIHHDTCASEFHAASIQYAMDHFVNTKYMLLCDNDIVFKPTFISLIDNKFYNNYDIIGNYSGISSDILLEYYEKLNVWEEYKTAGLSDNTKKLIEYYKNNFKFEKTFANIYKEPKSGCIVYDRLIPFMLFVNMEQVKNKNIYFYNGNLDNSVLFTNKVHCDTGATFTTQCIENQLNIYSEYKVLNTYAHLTSATLYKNDIKDYINFINSQLLLN